MGGIIRQFLFWSPRILGILFALFLSLFALDVFNEDYGFWDTIVAFLIHLTPTLIVLLIVFIAWYRDDIGTIMFLALAVFYMLSSNGGSWIIAGSVLLISILFLMGYFLKRKHPEELGQIDKPNDQFEKY